MLVSYERWQAAIRFLTSHDIGPNLTARDQRLLSLHFGRRPLTVGEAMTVLTRIGWTVHGA